MGMTNLIRQVQNSAAHGTAGSFKRIPCIDGPKTIRIRPVQGCYFKFEESEAEPGVTKNCPTLFLSVSDGNHGDQQYLVF